MQRSRLLPLGLALSLTSLAAISCVVDGAQASGRIGPPASPLMAFQSVRQAVTPSLGTPPSEIVLISQQEYRRSSIVQPAKNTLRSNWFDGVGFTPGIHLGQLEDGTGIVELGWTTSWYQAYYFVFLIGTTEAGRDVTHLGLLSDSDIGSEWMRIDSARVSLLEGGEELQLKFQISGDLEYDRNLAWFEGSITCRASTMADLGVSDLSWGSFKALDDLLGMDSPFARK